MPSESKQKESYDSNKESEEENSDDDYKIEEQKAPEPIRKAGRRGTVMAAAVTVSANWVPPSYEKSVDEAADLMASVSQNVLFKELQQDEMKIIIQAMKRLTFRKGEDIIRQGDEGDLFYVVESGTCECYIKGVGKVMTIGNFTSGTRNFFGELALLYDAPRAATVKAVDDVVVWGLDRVTFKKILQDTTQKQRNLYIKFLGQVPVLTALSVYERLTIADALTPKYYSAGETIIVEGEEGFEFFIVESGEVICTKKIAGKETDVSDALGVGDYFGELSLINNEVRAATVRATKDTTCLSIDRKTFKRLLGPLETLLREHGESYAKYIQESKE